MDLMERGLVSIIVPVYNVERYLNRCLTSLVHQTYKNIEIILINDGATDNSGKICEAWAKKDQRIQLVCQENRGVSEARNSAMKIMQGEFLTFVDSDDWVESTMVETFVKNMEMYPEVDAVFCGYTEVKDYTDEIIQVIEPLKTGIVSRNEGVAEIFGEYSTMLWNKCFRMNILEQANDKFDPKLKIGEDELWMVKALFNANRISLISTPLYFYRNRTEGASKDFSLSQARLSEIESQKMVLNVIRRYNSKELVLLAQKRMYFSCQKIMKIAYYQNEYELFDKIDIEIQEAREVWFQHHKNFLGKCRRKLVEQMMRKRIPGYIVRIFDK